MQKKTKKTPKKQIDKARRKVYLTVNSIWG